MGMDPKATFTLADRETDRACDCDSKFAGNTLLTSVSPVHRDVTKF